MLCQVAADICFEDQTTLQSLEGAAVPRPHLKGNQNEGINVLGVVTLHDIGRLESESETGRGWVACAFFLGTVLFSLFTDCLHRYDGRCILREAAVLRPRHRHDVFFA